LSGTPAIVWAIVTFLESFILLFAVSFGLMSVSFTGEEFGEMIGYLIHVLFIIFACFLILLYRL